MKRITTLLLLCICGCFTSPSSSQATLIAYESFSGSEGTLIGQTGGTGLGAWSELVSGHGTTTVYSDGLTYSSLDTTGGRAYIVPAVSGKTGASSTLTTSVNTGTAWLSFLINSDSGTRYCDLSITSGSTAETVFIGHNSGVSTWGLSGSALTGVTSTNSSVAVNPGVTTLMLLRVDFNTSGDNERLRLYINPDVTITDPDLLTAQVDVTTISSFSIDGITIAAGYGSGTTTKASVDEIRVGTELKDAVAAVPEPQSSVLVAAGLCLILILSRKHTLTTRV